MPANLSIDNFACGLKSQVVSIPRIFVFDASMDHIRCDFTGVTSRFLAFSLSVEDVCTNLAANGQQQNALMVFCHNNSIVERNAQQPPMTLVC